MCLGLPRRTCDYFAIRIGRSLISGFISIATPWTYTISPPSQPETARSRFGS